MDLATAKIDFPKLGLLAAAILGLIICFIIGLLLGTNPTVTLIVVIATLTAVAWIIFARDRWWVVIPMAGAIGGYFYFGHKIYTTEVALLACFAPLAIARSIRAPGLISTQPFAAPAAMYALVYYLVAHWAGSCIYNGLNGESGYGNVARVYLTPVGLIAFALMFRKYGSTRYIPLALSLTYWAALFRVAAGFAIYFTNSFAYIPIINYVLPGSTHSRSADLRASGLVLLSISLCYLLINKRIGYKLVHWIVLIISCVAIAFGAGRTSIILGASAILFAAALYRKVIPFVVSFATVLGVVFILNTDTAILNHFPPGVQRTLSILLLNRTDAAYYGRTTTSDEWHEELRSVAYSRWTQSWNTFFFGTGVRPFDVSTAEYASGITTTAELLEAASKVGAYESGWWTVIAVTGAVGLLLYLVVLLFLLRRLLPVLIKEKVSDHAHAFAFLAVFGIINWLILGWTNGSFPSTEIMFGFIAVGALRHEMRAQAYRESRTFGRPLAATVAGASDTSSRIQSDRIT